MIKENVHTVSIESYTPKYCEDVLKLIENFYNEAVGEYDDLFDVEALKDRIKELEATQAQNCFLLIIDDVCQGLIFGIEYLSMLNNRKIFQEAVWYVNPDYRRYGVKLLLEAEKELKSRGFSIMIMAVLENSKTDKIKWFYRRMGYKPMEVHYVRNL